eukprot:1850478-Amphidinium_carterae.2
MDNDAPPGEEQKTAFWSLLGGASWMTQSRPDIAVWIHSLQRAAKTPQKLHAVKLNSLVKYMKKNHAVWSEIWTAGANRARATPVFRRSVYIYIHRVQPESPSGLAVRGSCTALTAASTCRSTGHFDRHHASDRLP